MSGLWQKSPAWKSKQGTIQHLALIEAARLGDVGRVNTLLQRGVDPAQTDPHGCTALHIAARWGHESVVNSLLAAGLDRHVQDNYGWQPLHEAAVNGCFQSVARLLKNDHWKGSYAGKKGVSPMTLAIAAEDKAVALELARNGIVEGVWLNDMTVLHWAAENGYENLLSVALRNGVEHLDPLDINGRTPLHYAVVKGAGRITSVLAEKGAKVNARDVDGNTPLHLAAQRNRTEILIRLLKHGADPRLRNIDGQTAKEVAEEKEFSASGRILQEAY